MSNKIEEIDGVGGSKRANNIELARAQMQKNAEARKARESAVNVDVEADTGSGASKNFSYSQNQTQKDQETFGESYDTSGSISGGYNAGSTINSSQGSNADTDGGGNSSNNGKGMFHRTDDSAKLESKGMKESKLKNTTIKLF